MPFLLFAGLLLKDRQYYGQKFWARPGITQVITAHNWLFSVGGYLGWAFTVGVTVMFAYWSLSKTVVTGLSGYRKAADSALPIEECVLTLMLLWLPVIGVIVAKVSHRGMTYRHMLPSVPGGGLGVGYLTTKLPGAVRVLLLILMFMNYGLSSVAEMNNVLKGSLFEPRAGAAREVKEILTQHHESDLPIVISSGLRYLPMAYYTPPGLSHKLYAVTDPHAAVMFAGSDSVDLGLLVLRRYFPLRVEDYGGFAS